MDKTQSVDREGFFPNNFRTSEFVLSILKHVLICPRINREIDILKYDPAMLGVHVLARKIMK